MDGIKVYVFKAANKFSRIDELTLDSKLSVDISENDYVYISIVSDFQFYSDSYLWLSDYRFKIILNSYSEDKYYYTILADSYFSYSDKDKFTSMLKLRGEFKLFLKLFINTYGTCEIELETKGNELVTYKKLGNVKVSSEKISDINHLLNFLIKKDIYYWESLSLTKNEASDFDKNNDNILWVLSKINQVLDRFDKNFIPQLLNDPFYRLVPIYKRDTWSEKVTISEESIFWLLDNFNQVEGSTANEEGSFLLLNRIYKSKEILTETLIKDTDIPENQIVHFFINGIYTFLFKTHKTLDVKLAQVGHLLDFRTQIHKSYFERLKILVSALQTRLEEIKHKLNLLIPVKTVQHVNVEQYRLHSKQHYKDIVQLIYQYNYNREAVFSQDILFTGTNDISKLYEIFCLFSLIDVVTMNLGFEKILHKSNHVNQYKKTNDLLLEEDNYILTHHSFKKGNIVLNVYYELLPDCLLTVALNGNKAFRPDFTLEFIEDNKKSYLIFDAKYKKIGNIETHDYEELTLKYLHGIGLKDGGKLNALGLFVLNPIFDSGISFYQKGDYSLFGNKPTFPIIGRVELNVEDNKNHHLTDVLNKYLELLNIVS